MNNLSQFAPLAGTAFSVLLFLIAANWILKRINSRRIKKRLMPRQFIMLALSLAGLVAVIIALPVSDATRNQLIALIGVLLSAVVAFSSTTIVSNFMAWNMMRITRPFQIGEFIKVGDYFGRVTEQGLLDTEIQTESRELISLPNSYLIANPVSAIQPSGAIVSAELSLGYDIHHSRIQRILIGAAENAGLEDPFVRIIQLGDYSVTYRISGLLPEVRSLISTRSDLMRKVLDALHGNKIEIVSPSFMNQRRMDGRRVIAAPPVIKTADAPQADAEVIMFDKADLAQQRDQTKQRLHKEIKELEEQAALADGDEKQKLEALAAIKRARLEKIDRPLEESE